MTFNKVTCLRHRGYDGTTNPDITCKACCKIFMSRIRDTQSETEMPAFRQTTQRKVNSKEFEPWTDSAFETIFI
jgi:hypothetical protein